MLQPDSSLPEVPRHPAPWDLRGSGWIVALKLARDDPARNAFVPGEIAGRGRGLVSYLMYVDYRESACGPYRELLFLPGAFPFGDGRRHPSISRILVSTWKSVVNGRANWGIGKDRADFDVESATTGLRLRVTVGGREACELEFARPRIAPSLPLATGWLPRGLRTLAQRHDGHTFYYAPEARGLIRPGRLASRRFDPDLFPDLSAATVLATFAVTTFRMHFPVARVTD